MTDKVNAWSHPHENYTSTFTRPRVSPSPPEQYRGRTRTSKRPKRIQSKDKEGGNISDPELDNNRSRPKKRGQWNHPHDEYSQSPVVIHRSNNEGFPKKMIRPSREKYSHLRTSNAMQMVKDNAKRNLKRPQRVRFGSDTEYNIEMQARNKYRGTGGPPTSRVWTNSSNIHEVRSARRTKPQPPRSIRTYSQKRTNAKQNFAHILEQACKMEGLNVMSDNVQRMITRMNDTVSDVPGFDRFLQQKESELGKVLRKSKKRKKQMQKLDHDLDVVSRLAKGHKPDLSLDRIRNIKQGSVRDLTAMYNARSTDGSKQKQLKYQRRQKAIIRPKSGRAALRIPSTRSHRRRVSGQFNASNFIQHSPQNSIIQTFPDIDINSVMDDDSLMVMMNKMDSNEMPTLKRPVSTLVSRPGSSRTYKTSFDGNVRNVTLKVDSDRMLPKMRRPSISQNDSNILLPETETPVHEAYIALVSVLKKEPHEKTEEEIDMLVRFFENYQIMTEDVDRWSGKATFRAFIQQTRFKQVQKGEYIFKQGDKGDEFYFVLNGEVSVLMQEFGHETIDKDEESVVESVEKIQRKNTDFEKHKREIHVIDSGHIFGELAMFNAGERSATCQAKTLTDLAFWNRETYNEYIRPMKELNSKAKRILMDKQGNDLSEDALIEKAAMFLDDAIHGRELKMHRNGTWPRRIHKLINNRYFNWFLVSTAVVWLLMAGFEPPSYKDSYLPSVYQHRILPLLTFEWMIFCIFFMECMLRVYSFGRVWFFTIDLHVWRVVLLFVIFIDLLTASVLLGQSFRFSRIMRPFFLMLYMRDLRRQYYIVISTIPYVSELMLIYLVFICIFARIAIHLFTYAQDMYIEDDFIHGSGGYAEQLSEQCIDEDCTDYLDFSVWLAWDGFQASTLTLFVLLSTENYPDVFWPSWLYDDGHFYFTFFIAYMMFATFFIMNLFSAAVYDAYQNIIARIDVIDEKRETSALKVAWICLDNGGRGTIGKKKFGKLIKYLKPFYTEFEVDVLFRLMDPDNNGLIDDEEFSLMMINCLYLSISRKPINKDDEHKLYLQRIAGSCPCGYAILSIFVTGAKWRYFIAFLQLLDMSVLLGYHFPSIILYLRILDFICVLFFIFEIFMHIIFKSSFNLKTYFSSTTNKLYFALTAVQFSGSLTGIIDDHIWLSCLKFIGITRIIVIVIFCAEKFPSLRSKLSKTLTQTMFYMIPVFARIMLQLAVVLMYMFAIAGMEIFIGEDESTWGQKRCDGAKQLKSDPYALFCDLPMAYITLCQILSTNNWHIVMYRAIEITGTWWVAWYFVLFFLMGPILILSLLLAVFFNMFFGVSMQSEHELSAFFEDADADDFEALEMQQQQEFNKMETLDYEMPKECGINDLPDGRKVLTVRVPLITPQEEKENTVELRISVNTVNDDGIVSADSLNLSNKQTPVEYELKHIPIKDVARMLYEAIPGETYYVDNNGFAKTFVSSDVVQFMTERYLAPNDEEAVDVLSYIMEEYGAFHRVDAQMPNEFINSNDAHYQWIPVFLAESSDEEEYEDDRDWTDQEIYIGVRHSYGAYHRIMKRYRQAGLDPGLLAAREQAAQQFKDTPVTQSPVVQTDADGVPYATYDNINPPSVHLHSRERSERLAAELSQFVSNQKLKHSETMPAQNASAVGIAKGLSRIAIGTPRELQKSTSGGRTVPAIKSRHSKKGSFTLHQGHNKKSGSGVIVLNAAFMAEIEGKVKHNNQQSFDSEQQPQSTSDNDRHFNMHGVVAVTSSSTKSAYTHFSPMSKPILQMTDVQSGLNLNLNNSSVTEDFGGIKKPRKPEKVKRSKSTKNILLDRTATKTNIYKK